jgi:hypothetical protein
MSLRPNPRCRLKMHRPPRANFPCSRNLDSRRHILQTPATKKPGWQFRVKSTSMPLPPLPVNLPWLPARILTTFLDHNDADQDVDVTFNTLGGRVEGFGGKCSPKNQQPQDTTVMRMSIQDSEANTADNSHSLSGIKVASLIHSFDNA